MTYTLNTFFEINQDPFATTEVLLRTMFSLNIRNAKKQRKKSGGNWDTNDAGS